MNRYIKAAIVTIIVGTIIRLILATMPAVSGDPCWYLNVGRFIAENNAIPLYEPLGRMVFWPPPFFHMITAIFYKLFGLFSMRFIAPLSGGLSLLYTYLIGKKLFNERIAGLAVICLALIPIHLYLSSISYMATMVSLFTLMSAYYLLNKKMIIGGIFAGAAMLTKYSGLFMVPLGLVIIYKTVEKKDLIKKAFLFLTTSGLIGSVWYIGNWVLLGSPLAAISSQAVASPSLVNLFRPSLWLKIYLSIFGVPAGNIRNLFFLDMPFLEVLIGIWAVATIIFCIPIVLGIIKNKKHRLIIFSWIGFFSLMLLLNMFINNMVWFRHAFPMAPMFALLWAVGLDSLQGKFKHFNKFLLLLLIIMFGFLVVEVKKANITKGNWGKYEDDFRWVQDNTPQDAILLVPFGDCYSYYMHRFTYGYNWQPYINTREQMQEYNINYIWVNQEIDFYGPEGSDSSAYAQDFLEYIKTNELIYHNKETQTEVYKVR